MNAEALRDELHCDTCIIGGGPAGLTLADALTRRGSRVVVLESAAATPDPEANALNQGTISGGPLQPLGESRARAVGGTTAIWSTYRDGVVGGKFVRLDPIDFEARDLTPWSGWPLSRSDLDPWYDAAHLVAGLEIPPGDGSLTHDGHPLLPFPDDGLTNTEYYWGRADIFTHTLPAALRASTLATFLVGATAIGFEVGDDPARLNGVRWRGSGGTSGVVRARTIVCAAGAVENARLLLAHHRDLGRPSPYWLGRGFMEHPIDRSLTLITRHPALSPQAGFYAFADTGPRARLVGRIGLSEKLQRAQALRNASLRLFPVRHRFLMRQLRQLAHRLGRTPPTTYRILLDLEQAPHPDNRVTLADQLDRFGCPRAHLHCQWRPEDEAVRLRLQAVIRDEFARCNAGTVVINPVPPLEPGVHHHAGTTRMHHDPEHGVVDAQLRVHGTRNLYLLGASVFPTCGVANPTLTVLALALRLADQLTRG